MIAFFYFQKEFCNVSSCICVGTMVILYLFEQLDPKLRTCHKLTNQKILIFVGKKPLLRLC